MSTNSIVLKLLLSAAIAALVSACASSSPAQPENVVIAPLGSGDSASTAGITREELEDHVRRFADRYMTRVALAANGVADRTEDEALKSLMLTWKSVSFAAVVDIAIGPNAVTNLLDMMTLTRLSRLVVDSHWAPDVLGPELGEEFLQAFIALDEDIWTVADDVLTDQQQQELAILVEDWHMENPDQVYPWYVKLSNFSGQRAASLAAVQQTGGMLKEVARAREAAEEIQAFGERVLFYLQRAPMITSLEFEASAGTVLGGPAISQATENMDRFVTSVEQLVQSVDDLPGSRLAVVDQFMERLGSEREALVRDISSSEENLVNFLAALQPALESLERTIVASKINDPNARPFDINEYRALMSESATTAIELRQLVETVESLMQNSEQLSTLVTALVEAENAVVDRAFRQAIALIFIFFAVLLAYRLVTRKLIPKQV
jgi:hypothetical protein